MRALPTELVEQILTVAQPALKLRVQMLMHDNKRCAKILGILEEALHAQAMQGKGTETLRQLQETIKQQKTNEKEILQLLGLCPQNG